MADINVDEIGPVAYLLPPEKVRGCEADFGV